MQDCGSASVKKALDWTEWEWVEGLYRRLNFYTTPYRAYLIIGVTETFIKVKIYLP